MENTKGGGAIASNKQGVDRAPCQNCSQTLPRLWALANRTLPNGAVKPGHRDQNGKVGIGPPEVWTPPTTPNFESSAANAKASPVVRKDGKPVPALPDLGVWSNDNGTWKRTL